MFRATNGRSAVAAMECACPGLDEFAVQRGRRYATVVLDVERKRVLWVGGRWPMHTGLLEGTNNRIKAIKRIAYGYRDDTCFFLKIRAVLPGVGR